MKNNRIKTILKISLPLLVLGIAVAGWGFYYFVQKPNTTVKDNGIIYIRKGDSFETVMQALLSKCYIKNEYTLRQVARLKQYPRLVKAGRYRIQDGMSNNQLVNMLRAGNQEAVPFTFNNIRTLPDFARTANRQLGIDSAAFMSLVKDTLFLDSLGFTPATFIAMFIPNTYQIYWNTSLPAFIKRMHAEYRRFWTPERLEKAGKAGFTPIEISTIASIVEEETTVSAEYPVIAGVYINRLRKGWKMEACPTLKFALGDFTIQRVLDRHKQVESPYNTYKYAGLPPGPVRMPSSRAIDAVLDYQHHDYMFFCAKSDFSGTHHFSRTLREHNRHAREYHRALDRMRIY